MSCLYYRGAKLFIEDVCLEEVTAKTGTPTYFYSRAMLEANWRAFQKALRPLSHRICYAVKANANIGILNLLAKLNSGFDIVSSGELQRVITAAGDPQKTVFSGVGKTTADIEFAIQSNIYCFNVESVPELMRLQQITSALKKKIKILLRINPDINANTHPYIATGLKENKFGIEISEVLPLCRQLKTMPYIELIGIGCHLGSQITELSPFAAAIDCLLLLYQQISELGFSLSHLNLGGGLGIIYHDEQPPTIQQYADLLKEKLSSYALEIMIEPGRAIIGNAGVLITRVEYLKETSQKNFAIVDAGMTDLLRPALYQAWQPILPIHQHDLPEKKYDIVGPVCESADFLGKERALAIKAGDLLAVDCAGAYGFSMSSNYNSRPRPAEIMIDGDRIHFIRQRETIPELFQAEKTIDL